MWQELKNTRLNLNLKLSFYQFAWHPVFSNGGIDFISGNLIATTANQYWLVINK